MENSLAVPQKLNIELLYNSAAPLLRYIPKKTEDRHSNKYTYIHVHSSTIHYSQKVETAQLSTNEWMDKQIVACPYDETLLSHIKK